MIVVAATLNSTLSCKRPPLNRWGSINQLKLNIMLKNLKDIVKNKSFINSVKKAKLKKTIKYGGRTFRKIPDFDCFRCYNCIFEDYDQCAKIDCLENGNTYKTFHIEEIIE